MSFTLRRFLCCLGLFAFALGCTQAPAIHTYEVTRATPDRLLGGMLLAGERAWFFKLTGPKEEIDAKADDFREFLKSVRVSDTAPPTWKLPEGWEVDSKPNQMRFATILVPVKGGTQELTVTMLGLPAEDHDQYLLSNINRWRDQLSQGRIDRDDLKGLEKLSAGDSEVWIVNVAGKQKAAGMMTPPFAGRG